MLYSEYDIHVHCVLPLVFKARHLGGTAICNSHRPERMRFPQVLELL